jgi:hypothetical protein
MRYLLACEISSKGSGNKKGFVTLTSVAIIQPYRLSDEKCPLEM